jgi:hypothetical protein
MRTFPNLCLLSKWCKPWKSKLGFMQMASFPKFNVKYGLNLYLINLSQSDRRKKEDSLSQLKSTWSDDMHLRRTKWRQRLSEVITREELMLSITNWSEERVKLCHSDITSISSVGGPKNPSRAEAIVPCASSPANVRAFQRVAFKR